MDDVFFCHLPPIFELLLLLPNFLHVVLLIGAMTDSVLLAFPFSHVDLFLLCTLGALFLHNFFAR
jgi:hypothetical protein